MSFDYNILVKVLLVVLAVGILVALILQYQKKNPKKAVSQESKVKEDFMYPSQKEKKKKYSMKEKYEDNPSSPESPKVSNPERSIPSLPKISQPVKASSSSSSFPSTKETNPVADDQEYDVQPMEDQNNEDYKAVDFEVTNSSAADCYPRDRLTTKDLLPQDANSKFAELNPAGQGDVKDQNFLQPSIHFGIDTVSNSLKNANQQLRSDPPIPKIEGLSPWNNTTIEYDSNRRFFELGSV